MLPTAVQKESERPAYEALVFFALRLPEFRKRAIRIIDPGDIPYSDIFSIWLAIRDLERQGASVDPQTLKAFVQPRLVDGVSMPDQLIDEAFRVNLSGVSEEELTRAATAVMEQIVDDIIARKLRKLTPHGFRPSNLVGELEKIYQQGVRLKGMNLDGAVETFDGPIPDLSSRFYASSTGIGFIDFYMGGLVRGELCGVIGPTGGGKTTLGVQLGVSLIKSGVGPVFYVYFEPDAEFIRVRAISCTGLVKLQSLVNNELSSDPNLLKQYEQEIQKNIPPDRRLTELDRAAVANAILNQRMFIISALNSPSYETLANPAVLEQVIARKVDELGTAPAAVIVDWIGIQAEIQCETKGSKMPIRYYLSRTINEYLKMADRLQTSIWIFHQLTGRHLDQKPGHLVTHSQALESKSFANMMSFCFGLGVTDRMTGCVTFNCSKSRRSALRPHRILQFDPSGISRFLDVSDRYTIDPMSRNIVPVDEIQTGVVF